jgi:DNA-binding NtrC family response regulator
VRLLIIGELNGHFGLASSIAILKGSKVKQVSNIEAAFSLLRNGSGADLILMDAKQDIKSFIDQLYLEHIVIDVIACGFDNNTLDAVNAIKAGAKEYLPLPPDEELIASIFQAISHEEQLIVGKSPLMAKIYKLIDQVAPSDANILITGESGTGKEVFSRNIHQKSKRSDRQFISVNCAAIPDNLLESELFGHEKGSFTGAIAKRIGKFEESNGGTLLLDEISEIDIKLQAKLLRAIQEREISRIGGNQTIKLNLRIIATSNRDLKTEVAQGRFREDLYFRLNIIQLQLIPLRQRKEDIIEISERFIKKYSKNNNIEVKRLSDKAKEALMKYDWPGNIRELENTIHRSVLLSTEEEITPDSLMLEVSDETPHHVSELVGRKMMDVEKQLILSTLDHCLGNRTHAANILGISIKTLRNKLNIYSEAKISAGA